MRSGLPLVFAAVAGVAATTMARRGSTNTDLEDEDRLDILAIAGDLGLGCGGGFCGGIALAINRLLFGGSGEPVAAVNRYLWKTHRRPVGHVGVRAPSSDDPSEDIIWDAEGTFEGDVIEDFLAWGMLETDDPDYAPLFPKPTKTNSARLEKLGSDVILLDGDEALDAIQIMGVKGEDVERPLMEALARWARRKKRG